MIRCCRCAASMLRLSSGWVGRACPIVLLDDTSCTHVHSEANMNQQEIHRAPR
jgi:hypothetical protein